MVAGMRTLVFYAVWRALSCFPNGPLCVLVSSVCGGRQHASSLAGGHLRSDFEGLRPCMGLSMSSTNFEQRHLFLLLLILLFGSQRSPSFRSLIAATNASAAFLLSCFLVLFLLLDRAASFLPPRPQIGHTLFPPGRTLIARSMPANWMIAGAGDQTGLRV
jgi:hypothetical protein